MSFSLIFRPTGERFFVPTAVRGACFMDDKHVIENPQLTAAGDGY